MEISRRKEIYVGKRRGDWCCDEEGCTGEQVAVTVVPTCSDPGGSLGAPAGPQQCQAARAVPLLIPPQTKAALWAHLSTAAPLLPSCHVPFLPPLHFSFNFLISFLCPQWSVIPIITAPHVFHFSYHKCHSHTANTRMPQPPCESISALSLETYLIWDGAILKIAAYFWMYISVWVDVRDQLSGQLQQCKSPICTGLALFTQ